MYLYIMQRTQIYLTKRESAALAKAAAQTGRTRSQLIREAIGARYLVPSEQREALDALEATDGIWSGHAETGEATVERLRPGRLGRLHREG